MMSEELRKLQDLLFTEFVSKIDLKPIATPIVEADFPGFDWGVKAATETCDFMIEKSTQLGFYDLQIPTATTTSRKDRSLSLILDLDQTLVHAMKLSELLAEVTSSPLAQGSEFESFLQRNFINNQNPKYIEAFTTRIAFSADSMVPPVEGNTNPSSEPRQLLVTWLDGEIYLIKLRPGLRTFLKDLAEIYELHIYTKANRNYLNFLINELDPLGKIFASAVARDDSPDLDVDLKVMNRVCCRPMDQTVVFDDRVDIWSESTGNVIKAQAYNFLSTRKFAIIKALEEIVMVSQSPNSENTAVAIDFDCHLYYMDKVLQRVHREFVQSKSPKIQGIIQNIRKSVLAGTTVMFTGFTDVTNYIKEAEEFGATCRATSPDGLELLDNTTAPSSFSNQSTILVASKHTRRVYDTKKQSPDIKIVHGAWFDHFRATWNVPDKSVFDHSRFRVNPDGTFGVIDNWEVVWIAKNQIVENNNPAGSEVGAPTASSIVSSSDMKKRRRI